MTALSANHCHDRLQRIIEAGIAALLRFDELLVSERQALESRATETLESATTDKTSCLGEIEELERARRQCCADGGFATDAIADCLAWCDPEGRLGERWQHYLTLAAACHKANLTNGAVIRARQQQIAAVLTALNGGSESATYDRSGADPGRSSRALAEA